MIGQLALGAFVSTEGVMRSRYAMAFVALVALAAVAAVGFPSVGRAEPEKWHAGVIGGGELNFAPNLDNQLTGHGWAGFDSVGEGIVGGGNLRLFYNTTKVHVGIERLGFARDKLAFFAFLEGEALISQLLNDYFQQGRRINEYGIEASYALLHTKLQWYPGKHQTCLLYTSPSPRDED